MSDLVPVRRALISVSDKTGLKEFASALANEFNVELISTGGTAKFLREAGLPVKDVSDVTGFPEMMDGRVKTLHPKIHGGLLALRDNPEHQAAMREHGIEPIDLVCINLYPFAKTIEKPGVTFEEAIENIDIGGPSMIRSAAKNHRFVLVVTSPDRYEKVLGDLREHGGSCCGKHRLKQAQRAFAHTAEYDSLIQEYLAEQIEKQNRLPGSTGAGVSRFAYEPHSGRIALATEEPPPENREKGSPASRNKLVQRLLASSNNLNSFLADLVTTQAVVVAGTEAVAFGIESTNPVRLETIAHIRPDKSSQAMRDQAIAAFKEIVTPCIEQDKNGAIMIEGTEGGGNPQFCLVTLLRNEGNAVACSAVITRCRNQDAAQQRLMSMELVAGYFDLYTLKRKSEEFREQAAENRAILAAAGTGPRISQPSKIKLKLAKKQDLRYGENPHQTAALYVADQPKEASVAFAKQLHGKELSYINLLDADGALSCVKEFDRPAACIVKHTTPCGCAVANDLPTAFQRAYDGDPLAAFGGIVALNRDVDLATAQAITSIKHLLEVIVAPSYAPDALEMLRSRWKNVRLLEVGAMNRGVGVSPARTAERAGGDAHATFDPEELSMHKIVGGYLVQQRDLVGVDESTWRVASKRQPTDKEMADLKFAWLVCKHVKSNAIVVAKEGMLLGAGAGQMDRPSAARLAIGKAGVRAGGAVAASDAFFPFPDGPALLLDAGVTAIIQPGGAMKDQETIDLVDSRGAAMVFTGKRHFKH
jgi:AICAR transformylase/IMP cyclohydrolase PurH